MTKLYTKMPMLIRSFVSIFFLVSILLIKLKVINLTIPKLNNKSITQQIQLNIADGALVWLIAAICFLPNRHLLKQYKVQQSRQAAKYFSELICMIYFRLAL